MKCCGVYTDKPYCRECGETEDLTVAVAVETKDGHPDGCGCYSCEGKTDNRRLHACEGCGRDSATIVCHRCTRQEEMNG